MIKIADFLNEKKRNSQDIEKEIHELSQLGNSLNKLQNEKAEGYDHIQHEKINELVKEL